MGSIPALPSALSRIKGTGVEFGRRLSLHPSETQQAASQEGNLKNLVRNLLKEDAATVSFIERSRSRNSYSASQVDQIDSRKPKSGDQSSGLQNILTEIQKVVDKLHDLGDAPNSGTDAAAKERDALFKRLGELSNDDSIKAAFKLISGFEERLSTGKASLSDILNEAAQHTELFGEGFLRAVKNGEVGAIKSVADIFRTISDPNFTAENVDRDQLEDFSSQIDAALATDKGIYTAPEQPSTIESGLDGLISLVKRLKKLIKSKGESLESPDVKKAIDDEILKTNSALKATLDGAEFKKFIELVGSYYNNAHAPKANLKVIGELLHDQRQFVGNRIPTLFAKGNLFGVQEVLDTFHKLSSLQIGPDQANPDALDSVIDALKDAKKLIKGEKGLDKPKVDVVKEASITRNLLNDLKKQIGETTARLALGLGEDPTKALNAQANLDGNRAAYLLVIDDSKKN